jgi:hypothetical protein
MRWREYNFTFGQKDPTPKVLLFFFTFYIYEVILFEY